MNSVKLMLAVAALLVSTACSGSKKGKADANKTAMAQRKGASVGKEEGRLLVVFFSHAGDNYAVGNVKLGNTKIVADYISELTGADQFEIRTSKYDGMGSVSQSVSEVSSLKPVDLRCRCKYNDFMS